MADRTAAVGVVVAVGPRPAGEGRRSACPARTPPARAPGADPACRRLRPGSRRSRKCRRPVPVPDDVADMVVSHVIDNAAMTAASLTRPPIVATRVPRVRARAPSSGRHGSTVSGLAPDVRVSPEARPRGPTASRCAGSTSTTRSSRPTTPPRRTTSRRWSRSRSTSAVGRGPRARDRHGVQVKVDLVRAINLHAHKIDHVAHLSVGRRRPGHAADPRAGGHVPGRRPGAAHHDRDAAVRKGEISSWKAYAHAFAEQGRDRGRRPGDARRGRARPIYEE